jgi:hypothetical protein
MFGDVLKRDRMMPSAPPCAQTSARTSSTQRGQRATDASTTNCEGLQQLFHPNSGFYSSSESQDINRQIFGGEQDTCQLDLFCRGGLPTYIDQAHDDAAVSSDHTRIPLSSAARTAIMRPTPLRAIFGLEKVQTVLYPRPGLRGCGYSLGGLTGQRYNGGISQGKDGEMYTWTWTWKTRLRAISGDQERVRNDLDRRTVGELLGMSVRATCAITRFIIIRIAVDHIAAFAT